MQQYRRIQVEGEIVSIIGMMVPAAAQFGAETPVVFQYQRRKTTELPGVGQVF